MAWVVFLWVSQFRFGILMPSVHRFECVGLGVGHTEGVAAVAISKKTNSFCVSGGQDRTVKLWNTSSITGVHQFIVLLLSCRLLVIGMCGSYVWVCFCGKEERYSLTWVGLWLNIYNSYRYL